jgi:hypothetical protein
MPSRCSISPPGATVSTCWPGGWLCCKL